MTNSGIVISMTTQKVILQDCCLTCTPTRNLLPLLEKMKNDSWMKPLREHLQLNDSLHLVTKSKLPVIQRSHHAVSRAAIVAQVKQLRLPVPCPLPTNFTKQVTNAIKNNQLKGVMKTRLLRQAAVFYWGLCPRPTHDEYVTMAVTLCENFPQLKDKKPINGAYWVSRSSVHIHACFSHTI